MGGGNIAWSLWVTKLAPADRVAEYMSVHTFTTGLRGMAAPFLGFWLAAQIGVQGVERLSADRSSCSAAFRSGGTSRRRTGCERGAGSRRRKIAPVTFMWCDPCRSRSPSPKLKPSLSLSPVPPQPPLSFRWRQRLPPPQRHPPSCPQTTQRG
ncbi:MAG: hypothetical protein R3F11_17460 [Verrucomicrobiales bacterium]